MSIMMDRVESYGLNRAGGSTFPVDPPVNRNGGPDPGVGCWLLSAMGSSASSPSSSSSSSSIGMNSDEEEDDNGGKSSSVRGFSGENEAESTFKGPLDMMDSLEEDLPIRRGISKYYNGKSKSFTSLAEAAAPMKDIAKPENQYSRRRRNLLSHHLWENKNNHRSFSHRGGGGISKKPIMSTSKSSLVLAMAAAAAIEMTNSGEDSPSGSGSSPTSSGSSPRMRELHMLPPLHPRSKGSFGDLTSSPPVSSPSPERGGRFYAWRSYSVADFPICFPPAAGGYSGDS